jgi:hypothetical protein
MNATRANALISAAILARMATGLPVNEAMDEVLGAGTYERLATTVYLQLRARIALSSIPKLEAKPNA